jgi:NTE family protein
VTRAVVLGGGGPVGVAWEAGLAAGLEEAGLRLADADLFVGTSAGSIIGSQLALGRAARDLYESQLAIADSDRPELRNIDISPLIQAYIKLYTTDLSKEEFRKEIGEYALASNAMPEEEWLPTFGRESNFSHWPERDFVCTAVDAATGEFVTWTRDSGVPLQLAVASSCAVPGVVMPVTINGRRYMDGGMGSGTNAELAAGYDKVLVVPVFAVGRARPGVNEAIIERLRKRFDDELQAIRDAGGEVEVISPDDESYTAFGPNLMDGTRRKPVAEAGLRQGRLEAERLRRWWAEP